MSDEELSRRHRRVSEAAAGAPSGAARAAIRREAERQAAARRSGEPVPAAANDSHWPMRAVAGLAVIGIAAGLWWQMRPQPAPEKALAQPAAAAAPAPMAAPAAVPADRAEATVAATANAVTAGAAESRAPPAHTAPRAVSGSQSEAKSAVHADSLASEVERRLPSAWHSTAPVDGLWVRLNAQGKVIDAGRSTSELQLMRASGAPVHAPAAADAAPAGRAAASPTPAEAAEGSDAELINARGVTLRIRVLREPTQP